jgi:hypothetical protein
MQEVNEATLSRSSETAKIAIAKLRTFIESQSFRGYDPYDALNSPLLRLISVGRKYPRIAMIQLMKRLPWNLRPLLLIPKGLNPKGLGLFLWGYAKLYEATGDPTCREICEQHIGLLKETQSGGWSGAAWGYNFDWQSRAFFVPKGTPTIVNSSFIGHALLDAYEFCGLEAARDLAVKIRPFLLHDLHRSRCGDTFCFSYTPHDKTIVHNANLLGASLLIRLDHYKPCDEAKSVALRALKYSLDRQRVDGSWWYADTDYQQWIDSFHTGFNLQAIQYFLDAGAAEEYREQFARGIQFYADTFFLSDGTAKYFHDRTFPIDVHSYAQAIVFFSRIGGHDALLDRILTKFLMTFQNEQGFFYFQQNKYYTNRIPYIRWSQAWAFHALTEYLLRDKDINRC